MKVDCSKNVATDRGAIYVVLNATAITSPQ